jgi:hypothetical protein
MLPRRRSLLSIAFFVAAMISAIAFVTAAVGYVRQFYATDVIQYLRWNPSTLTFTESGATFGRGGVNLRLDSTTALPTDNLAAVRAMVGLSNSLLTHRQWPGGLPSWDRPVLWGDHFRCTPSVRINVNGLSDCWTLQFRFDAAMALFAILPATWVVLCVRRALAARKPLSAFPVVAAAPASAK